MPVHDELALPFEAPQTKQGYFSSIADGACAYLHSLLSKNTPSLPQGIEKLTLFSTHQRPHLDEYMAIFLFRACLPKELQGLPIEETILSHATDDNSVRERWKTAAVFGLGAVQNGGAKPLLLFDEHVHAGEEHAASSAVSLVVKTLFGRALLPRGLFQVLREIDIIDAFGGAHPKHLANYCLRLHDLAASGMFPLSVNEKKAVVEACIATLLRALEKEVPFWQDSFWKGAAIDSFTNHSRSSILRQQPGFEQAQALLRTNLESFRQPLFPPLDPKNCKLTFATGSYRLRQTIMIPYLAALLPMVWGEECGRTIMGILWDARLITQIHYACVFRALENHFGAEPEDDDVETDVGTIRLRKVPTAKGNAGMFPWVLEITPKKGISNARQALISFVRKHNGDRAITLLRNTETGTLVVSRGQGISVSLWDAFVDWLIATEGSSDTEGSLGCWHIVTNAGGARADFVLNGNAAHRYVPQSTLTVDQVAQWIHAHG